MTRRGFGWGMGGEGGVSVIRVEVHRARARICHLVKADNAGERKEMTRNHASHGIVVGFAYQP